MQYGDLLFLSLLAVVHVSSSVIRLSRECDCVVASSNRFNSSIIASWCELRGLVSV